MGLFKKAGTVVAVLVAVQAVLIGLLKTPHAGLKSVQLYLISVIDSGLDLLVEPASKNLLWATSFEGGFLPVPDTLAPQPLDVIQGALPEDLQGAWLRVGPQVQFWPPTKRTHVFDGDGAVASIRVAGGKASYSFALLETPRYLWEKAYGGEFFPRIGEWSGYPGLVKLLGIGPIKWDLIDLPKAAGGQANTAVGFSTEGKLWAHHEACMPFRFRVQEDGAVESIGFDDLKGSMEGISTSAHPKHDHRTGETFFHGRVMMKSFYMGRIKDGILQEQVELPVGDGFHHDMFITRDYVVIVDGAMRFMPKNVVKKKPLWVMDTNRTLRFGVFPRKAGALSADNFVWIDAGVTAEIVHTMFGYNEGSKIFLYSPASYYLSGAVSETLGDMGDNQMHRFMIDFDAGTVVVDLLDETGTEFARVRDDRHGQHVRYGYSAVQQGSGFNFTGILKWDMQEKRQVGRIDYPPGMVGGEPVFAPREGREDVDGDDGYMVVLLWSYMLLRSTFAVYDAKTFSKIPVVEMAIPIRAPLGFHALWLGEADFQKQLRLP